MVELSHWDLWDPYKEVGNFSSVHLDNLYIDKISNTYEQTEHIYEDNCFAFVYTFVNNSKLLVATK